MPIADIGALMPLVMVLLLMAGAALKSKSIMLGGGGALMVMGYVAVRSDNNLFLGFWLLAMFFMVMASGVWLTQTVIGDTA